MTSLQPDESPRNSHEENPLKGRSIFGVERVSFRELDRDSVEYAKAVASLCLQVQARRLVLMDESAQEAVRALDIFEWNAPYPDEIRQRSFPYFHGDLAKHHEMARLEREYVRLKRSQGDGEPFKATFLTEPLHANTPTSYHVALIAVEREIDDIFDSLRRRCARGISVPGGRLRPTDFGELVTPLLYNKPIDTGGQIIRMVIRAEDIAGKASRRPIVEHMQDLWDVAGETQPNRPARLQSFNRHLRKLGVAILERQLPFDRESLVSRTKQILAEGHVDTFLSEVRTKAQHNRHQEAYSWLQGWGEGQHGSVPFGSWNPKAKEECFAESFKIVTRARHHSYHSFNRLRMETRSLGGELPLFREFAMDCFEDVRFVRCDNGDLPPGRGTVLSGARLDRLFHGLNPDRDILHDYRKDDSLWFANQVDNLETSTVVALRQWIGVTAPAEEFAVLKERYYYVVDNDHFSGSYGFAFGFPVSVVNTKLKYASHGLDEGPHIARDASSVNLSIAGLVAACREAGKNHLVLGHMSPLFGGMCNALPVGSKPVFGWELQHQTTAWRDLYGHVHWPWLINSYRDHRTRVDETIRPLAKADREIRDFATAGQKLFEAFRHRYGAWKADLTPGDDAPPRLLVRAYDIYREREANASAGKEDETIYIGAVDRTKPNFDPIPLLNCFTLELTTRNLTYHAPLPKKGDGSGKTEMAMWRRFVRPLIEYKTKEGESFEGPYELVIIGEHDIKRS
jgi:hypothetical protein